MNKFSRRVLALAGAVCLVVSSGCGRSGVPVTGKVTFKGQPVTGGSLIFSPVAASKEQQEPGKPAAGVIKADGTFELATAHGGGAQVGKHRVTFSPPAQEMTEEQRNNPRYVAPPPPFTGLVPKQVEIEVTSGMTDMEIELVKSGPGSR